MPKQFLPVLVATASIVWIGVTPVLARGGDDWAKLDQDIESLANAGQLLDSSGPTLTGLLRAQYFHAPNLYPPSGTQDVSGFVMDGSQVALEGVVNESYGYRFQLATSSDTIKLFDAYGTWQPNDYVRTTMGRFRPPMCWESQVDDSDRLFLFRTVVGALFYQREDGAMVSGSFEQLTWAGLLHNLLPVTIGNLAGGAVMVGLVYWVIYRRKGDESGTASGEES